MPKTLPMPEPVPQEVPEKEKVPVHARPEAQERAQLRQALAERAYKATETGIRRTAKFLGISEQQVANMIVTLTDRISRVLDVGAPGKKQAQQTSR
jgi:hypothetical protein